MLGKLLDTEAAQSINTADNEHLYMHNMNKQIAREENTQRAQTFPPRPPSGILSKVIFHVKITSDIAQLCRIVKFGEDV